MKSTVLKKASRVNYFNDKSIGIQSYGEGNSYPQDIRRIVNASGTGKSCVNVYSKFIFGRGFNDKKLAELIINSNNENTNNLLINIANDLAMFGGFAIHVNYNANHEINELQHIPFETLRFDKLDDNGQFTKIKYHPDWAKQLTNLRKWRKEDIVTFNLFNPDAQILDHQIEQAGGIENYLGQIYYHSNEGLKAYPLPIYDCVITDMNTEEGVANVSNRNARNNFLIAGALVNIDNTPESEKQESDIEENLKMFQGDEEACRLMYMTVENKDDIPQILNFSPKNYDKDFEVTLKTSQDNIGKAFNQPPILRSENVSSNFGADLMNNAYNFYNSVTEHERITIQMHLQNIFQYWSEQTKLDYTITPLSYQVEITLAEKLGKDNLAQLLTIINNPATDSDTKLKQAITIFGIPKDQAKQIINTNQHANNIR